MYTRKYINILEKRIKEKRKFLQVVIGPRQVGKTTLMTQFLKIYKYPSIYLSADNVYAANNTWLEEQAESARIHLKQKKAKEILLIIDEIQKIPNWSEAIKKIWDYDTLKNNNVKLIILGSSSLLLQSGLSESLSGRYEIIYMNHWTFNEMNEAFGWNEEKYCWFGGYPGSVPIVRDESRWKNYILNSIIDSTISKDVLLMKRIDKPALLKRLFELGCNFSGQVLSYNKMLGQLQDSGNSVTLSHYLNLLDNAGMLKGLDKYSNRILKQKSSSPKFQVHNTALISGQRVESYDEIKNIPAKWGRIIESAIGAHLLNHSFENNYKLYYWRAGDLEVDFIIKKGEKCIAIEIKSHIAKNLKGLSSFVKEFATSKSILIDDSNLNWKEFLKINPAELF